MSKARVQKDARFIRRETALKNNLKKLKKYKETNKKNDSTI